MEKNYKQTKPALSVRVKVSKLYLVAIGFLLQMSLFSQSITYTFTSAGATASLGPTQGQINTAYATTNVSMVTVAGGIQSWTVPNSGLYRIDITGASGGNAPNYQKLGGLGARMIGEFNLITGNVVQILVGQKGPDGCGNGGGGGGTYVVCQGTLLIAAGGGGGCTSDQNGIGGTTVTSGTADNPTVSLGGSNGNGGATCQTGTHNGGGGGGYNVGNSGNGVSASGGGGFSFLNGGVGGPAFFNTQAGPCGGFGGGGGGSYCTVGGGGGGGYSGGAGGQHLNQCVANAARTGGGGGGSYNIGSNQVNTPAFQSGPGRAIITSLCNVNLSSSSNPICAGTTVTLTTDAVSNYSWSNGATTSSIVITPAVTGNYSIVATSSMNCVASSVIQITVSPGLPVLSVSSSTNQTCLGKAIILTASGALSYTWTNGVVNGVAYTPSVTNTYTVNGQNGCGTTSAVTTVTVAPLQVGAVASPTIVCAANPATLTAVAAATGYTWQPFGLQGATVAVSPSVSTVYTVTVSDGTCSGTATLSLLTNPVPTIGLVASTSVVCVGDPVFMTASGGINYTWTPGNLSGPSVTVSPLGPTLYSVIGDNSVACTSSTTQIVLTNASPTVNVTASSTFVCSGDAVNLLASGSASSYAWINGPQTAANSVNPASTTIYTVVGANSSTGCTTTKTVEVTVFIFPVSITTPTSTVCSGTSLTLTANGADSFNWVNGPPDAENPVTPNVTTTYTVSGTTTSLGITCTYSSTAQINVNPNPTVVATSNRTLICKGEKTTLNATGALNFSWSSGANTSAATVSPNIVNIHTFSVTGTDANNCKSTASIQVKVNSCTGVEQLNGIGSQLFVYPNPAKGEFIIATDQVIGGSEITLSLVNELGQRVRSVILNSGNNYKATVSGLVSGLYIVTGQDGKQILNQKIMVQQ